MQFEGVTEKDFYSEIFHSSLGTVWTEGWINNVYHQDQGGPEGRLRFPISNMNDHPDSDIQNFENGYIVYYHPIVKGERDWNREPVAYPYLAGQGSLFDVQANQSWQDTGIALKDGDRIIVIQVGGSWTNNDYTYFDANGNIDIGLREGSLNDKAVIGSLIGRIGEDGTAFPLGRWVEYVSPNSGNLFLAMNDMVYDFENNHGYLTIQIFVESKK